VRTRAGKKRPETPPLIRPVARDRSKQQTREALVAAALELFAEEGLDAPSLDAICDRAGYTRGAFYVHFPDRDALLVAVMEKVGEAFLASVFEQLQAVSDVPRATESVRAGHVAEAAHRFVAAIDAGAYPLMPATKPSAKATPGPQVRPHQLLDACARSAIVRERYRTLVEASIEHVAQLARRDQTVGTMREGLDPAQVGIVLLATVIGAQTMAELGVAVDPKNLARTVLAMLSPSPALDARN
jgi:TetR/AcrR family transcriptional regulator, transcriptional repressor for nem operon